jgi:hypothetical protein
MEPAKEIVSVDWKAHESVHRNAMLSMEVRPKTAEDRFAVRREYAMDAWHGNWLLVQV